MSSHDCGSVMSVDTKDVLGVLNKFLELEGMAPRVGARRGSPAFTSFEAREPMVAYAAFY